MSLSGAISAAVSSLNAQSRALANVSTNLANSSTTGYKASNTSFQSLLNGTSGVGGVTTSSNSNLSDWGLVVQSAVETYMGIEGNGMFAVAGSASSNSLYYTRNGEFGVDADGYLVNGGNFLQGWPTDADGKITGGMNSANLGAIDTSGLTSVASATSLVEMTANLPADAAINDTFESDFEMYDSLGTAVTCKVTWEKTAANEWTASFADPVSVSDSSVAIGTVTPANYELTINFDNDGVLDTITPDPQVLVIENWTTGAADSSISLDMALTQKSPGDDEPSVALKTTQDGTAYGTLNGVSVEDDGTVVAQFSNGTTRPIYKVAVATFANIDGLSGENGGLYSANSVSGTPAFTLSGENGAGTIKGGSIETSTTDTNLEFSRMMSAQQAYSSSAQIMSTANSMFDTLINAVR